MNNEKIVIFHIGGVGEYGPIESILRSKFSKHIILVLFEARGENNEELNVHKQHSENGVESFVVPYCVSDHSGKIDFYVNKEAVSSSIFKPNAEASKMHLESYPEHIRTWGDNTILDKKISLESITLSQAIEKYKFPNPDIISIDAQGAELKILRSAVSCLDTSTTCIVSEVEFIEIYNGQDLISDQIKFLESYNFNLVDILNTQYWHPEMTFGKGFLTVGEAIFFKNHNNLSSLLEQDGYVKLIKFGCISFCLQRYSMTYFIMDFLHKSNFKNNVLEFITKNKEFKIINDLYLFMLENKNNYYNNKYIFKDFYLSESNSFKQILPYTKRRDRLKHKLNNLIDSIFDFLIFK